MLGAMGSRLRGSDGRGCENEGYSGSDVEGVVLVRLTHRRIVIVLTSHRVAGGKGEGRISAPALGFITAYRSHQLTVVNVQV